MKTPYQERIEKEGLVFRQKHFAVKIEKSTWIEANDEVLLRVTHNGYQWSTLPLLPEEAEKVLEALRVFLHP
jgi:hypothetical protein